MEMLRHREPEGPEYSVECDVALARADMKGALLELVMRCAVHCCLQGA
jgi:hypothetical protein